MDIYSLYILFGMPLVYMLYSFYRYRQTIYYQQTHTPYWQIWWNQGKKGEYFLYREMTKLNGYTQYLFNCYVPTTTGKLTEIDLIVLHTSGIYVIESKYYNGWIFGSERQPYWTQTLPVGKGRSQKTRFYNPLWQNRSHILHLRTYLQREGSFPMYSYVVFGNICTLKNIVVSSDNVVLCRNIIKTIQNQESYQRYCLSTEEIDRIYRELYPLTQVDSTVKKQHKQYVQSIKRKRRM